MKVKNIQPRETFTSLARARSLSYEETSVPVRNLERYVEDGWSVIRQGRHKVRVRREKAISRYLEDRLWALLFRMGFTHLSGEDGAVLEAREGNEPGLENQLDVVALDDESCLVVECKSSSTEKPKPDLQKDLALLAQLRSQVARTLQAEQQEAPKRRVGAVMALHKIVPSECDVRRAEEAQIVLLDLTGLEYYEKLVAHTGVAARYQLLAEVFADREIEGLKLTVPAVEARMGKQVAYTFAVPPEYLLKVGYVAHRARGELGSLGAYQRMVSRTRLKQIRDFIDDGGFFPTNIVVNFTPHKRDGKSGLRFEPTGQAHEVVEGVRLGWLHLPARYHSAWIIDGQHRLLAYSGHKRASTSALCVTAFDGVSIHDQAELFIDINSKQKKVSGNLLTELVATLNWESKNPDELVYSIVSRAIQGLGSRPDSPFHRRIKLADEKGSDTKCISLKSVADELRKTGFFIVRKQHGTVIEWGPLWQAKAEVTLKRVKDVLDAWFLGICRSASGIWEKGRDQAGGYLAMNDGVVACLEVLRSVFQVTGYQEAQRLSTEDLTRLMDPYAEAIGSHFAALGPSQIREFRNLRGVQGQTDAYRRIQAAIKDQIPEFAPEGLQEWIDQRAGEKLSEAYDLIVSIERCLQESIVSELKSCFGEARSSWWRQVPKNIRMDAVKRREETDSERGDEEERYLNLIDYRAIILAHWQDLFQTLFAYGETGNKEKRTQWLVTLNEIRNKIMHIGSSGPSAELTKSDFEFLTQINTWLSNLGNGSATPVAESAGA